MSRTRHLLLATLAALLALAVSLACDESRLRTGPLDGAPEENCATPGDEDDNGAADCQDPACAFSFGDCDGDGDGLTNAEEIARGLDPTDADTDDDGQNDGVDPCPDDATNACDTTDTDGDGVPDNQDDCPGTPDGCAVDADGCPTIDGDGDGVCDGVDTEPDTPAGCTVDATGASSDPDGDGVCDGNDDCPDTDPACETDAMGCPTVDADGDGVCDGLDDEADTPAGCTVDAAGVSSDTDGDGVCDGNDDEPDTPEGCAVDAAGVSSDADGDGVCDENDDEADTPEGCTVDAAGVSADTDGDGVCDGVDVDDATPEGCEVDATGVATDADGDGVCDGNDECADSPDGCPVDAVGCPETDTDEDGWDDSCDNCPETFNPDQADDNGFMDGDDIGDACETEDGSDASCRDGVDNDGDGDFDCEDADCSDADTGVTAAIAPNCETCAANDNDDDGYGDRGSSGCDNCPDDANPRQTDADDDGVGAACDCNDNDPAVGEAQGRTTWYEDADEDGYGDDDTAVSNNGCAPDSIVNPVTQGGDCDDTDEDVNPDATEICGDGTDQDCSGDPDDGDTDVDMDTYVDEACTDGDDCNDMDAGINPGADELCNDETDSDCDGADNTADPTDATTWYEDVDGDTYGDLGSPLVACDQPDGYVANSTDCNDGDGEINPAATESCDGVDNDCDESIDEDADCSEALNDIMDVNIRACRMAACVDGACEISDLGNRALCTYTDPDTSAQSAGVCGARQGGPGTICKPAN